MCGILAVIGKGKAEAVVQQLSKRMSHRGPDESGLLITDKGHILSHERLAVMDINAGSQPIQGTTEAWMVHNGEIYNHQTLRDTVLGNHIFRTNSDSEVIVRLYEEYGYDFCHMLDGMFAFVVINNDDFIVARDPLGVVSLYYGIDESGRLYFASEMKALADQCVSFSAFPSGHYYTKKTGFIKYYMPLWENPDAVITKSDNESIRALLIGAVKKQLMGHVPIGVLLSGGVGSSLLASIACRLMGEKGERLKTFAIGLNAMSPDVIAARRVADFIRSQHHEIYFTEEQGLAILDKLIWHMETYDVASIRSGVPLYFLSRAVRELGVKVVLSGDGEDEVFGGNKYFRNATSEGDFQKESIERVQNLSTADLLLADKSTMAHGLEVRVPFLDRQFLDMAMTIALEEKQPQNHNGIEKYILRKAFDTPEYPYLPPEILWRPGEQFCNGVGEGWIDSLTKFCSRQVTDDQMENAAKLFPYNTPATEEAFYYRCVFQKHFPQESAAQIVRALKPEWQAFAAQEAYVKEPDLCSKDNTGTSGIVMLGIV